MFKKYLLLLFMLAVVSSALLAQKKDRIISSYAMAFGSQAKLAEISYWMGQSDMSVAQLIEKHRSFMHNNDVTLKHFAIMRSYQDVFNKFPTEDEKKYWLSTQFTFSEMVQKHLEWLRGRPNEYEKVIVASYQMAFKRTPRSEELAYWKSQPVRSYYSLLLGHDDFIKKNPSTSPQWKPLITNSNAILINENVFNEVLKLPSAKSVYNDFSINLNNVISTGGGNCISTGGLNLIGQAGGN